MAHINPLATPIPGVGTDREKRVIDGRGFTFGYTEYPSSCYWSADDEKRPAVLCPCGCYDFQISYGDYECLVHCVHCEAIFCVYSD